MNPPGSRFCFAANVRTRFKLSCTRVFRMSTNISTGPDAYQYPHAPNFIPGRGGPTPLIQIGALGPETTNTYLAAESLSDRLKFNGASAQINGYESFDAVHRELTQG